MRKKQKPIELDAFLRYICNNKDCNTSHWLSLKETQTKNFIVVCTCGRTFKPKKIKKLKIVYDNTKPQEKSKEHTNEKVPIDIIDKCAKILIGYGFTETESVELLNTSYKKNPTNNCATLIKQVLESIGESNV